MNLHLNNAAISKNGTKVQRLHSSQKMRCPADVVRQRKRIALKVCVDMYIFVPNISVATNC
jgi:hypothetical protein